MPLLSWHQGVLYAPISILRVLYMNIPCLCVEIFKVPHLSYGQIEYTLDARCMIAK